MPFNGLGCPVIPQKRIEDCDGSDFDYDTVLNYAEFHDSSAFFELLHDRSGVGSDLDDILECYANENKEAICEYINSD